MASSISWVGNKVLDPNAQYRPAQNIAQAEPETKKCSADADSLPTQRDIVDEDNLTQQGPPPSTERGYIPYYLASNIGKNVRAEFIIGTSQYVDKTGKLIEVGINYFVLEDVNARTHTMCDLYSVKFVTVLQQ